MSSRPLFLSLTLALWLGVYALRTFVPAAVWNLADELPLGLKPMLALGTHFLGLLGVIIVFKRRRRVLLPVTYLFAATTIARQIFLTNDWVGPYLSMLSWALWLMLMAALADEIAAHEEERIIAPALAAAMALQVGMQSAWHGLDLPSVSGILAVAAAAAVALLLTFGVKNLPVPLMKRPHTSVAWMLLGPALFLEITFAGNLGRFGQATGFSLLVSALLIIAALLGATMLMTRYAPAWLRLVAIAAAALSVYAVPRVQSIDGLILLAVPFVIVGGLHAASARRVRITGTTAATIGTLVLFILIFGFYNFYEAPLLWALALAPLAIMLLLASKDHAKTAVVWTPFAGACALALLHLLPARPVPVDAADDISVLSYNIHHGFDDDGVPGMRRTANEIAATQPDVVALQEIGRGWTMIGGNDLVAYLRWRFPDYQLLYSPTNGQLWGNAIMTRLRVNSWSGHTFDADPGTFRYGYVGAEVLENDLRLHVYSVHLTADLEGLGGGARMQQAERLARALRDSSPIIVAGDFNALPEDPPIVHLGAGLVDLGAQAGLGTKLTWPAAPPTQRIDYIFGRGVRAISGNVKPTPASDHLPVFLRVQLDTTATNP